MDSNTFNRTLYSDDDGNFEIEYDPSVKYVSFIRNRKLNNMEYVQLSVNTFKILVTMIISSYHTFEVRIKQADGYAYLFNYWSDKSRFGGSLMYMIRTINGLNENEFHITQDIALEILGNSYKIEEKILDMDKTWNNNEKINEIYTPDLKPDESLGTGYEGEDECEQTWKDALSRLLNEIKYSSLPNRIQRLVSFVIAHQLLPRQIPYNVLRLIKDNYRYLAYLNTSVNVITLGCNEKGSERDEVVVEVNDSVDEGTENYDPNSEICVCPLCTPHSGEGTESDEGVDEVDDSVNDDSESDEGVYEVNDASESDEGLGTGDEGDDECSESDKSVHECIEKVDGNAYTDECKDECERT